MLIKSLSKFHPVLNIIPPCSGICHVIAHCILAAKRLTTANSSILKDREIFVKMSDMSVKTDNINISKRQALLSDHTWYWCIWRYSYKPFLRNHIRWMDRWTHKTYYKILPPIKVFILQHSIKSHIAYVIWKKFSKANGSKYQVGCVLVSY